MALTKITLPTETIRQGFTAVNTAIDDLASTDNAKGASCIGLEDSADNVSATNVEDAIAEIYLDHATTKTLAEVFNENADTTTGLTWGYSGGKVRSDNVIYTITDGTISLTDDATNYIQITPSGTIQRNTTGFTSGYCPIRTVVCASGLQTASTDQRAWFQSQNISTTTVGEGGTGLTTITDHGILVGSGTSPITPLAAMTNGQLPIGSTGADPVPAALTGTANQITVTNGAGSITLSVPTNPVFPGYVSADGLLFDEQTADPTLGANQGKLYTKDYDAGSGNLAELFWANENDDVCQVTYANAAGTATSVLGIVTGTVMAFGQNAAPVGWTRLAGGDTLYDSGTNNAMFCFAKTGDVAAGGSVDPQSTHNHGGSGGATTLTDSQSGVNTHYHGLATGGGAADTPNTITHGATTPATSTALQTQNSGSVGASSSHTHTVSASTAVYYVELILAKKV